MLVKGELHITLEEALKNSYDIGVCAKIKDSAGKICLVRRGTGDTSALAWEMPGGSVDGEESIVEALAREMKEETGLSLAAPARYVGCFDFHNIEKGIKKRKFCFEVGAQGEVALGPDHADHKFFTIEEIKAMSTDKSDGDYIFKDHYDIIVG